MYVIGVIGALGGIVVAALLAMDKRIVDNNSGAAGGPPPEREIVTADDFSRAMSEIDGGSLPEVSSDIPLRPGEVCHFELPARQLTFKTTTLRVGAYGRGMFAALPLKSTSAVYTGGMLSITSERLVFVADGGKSTSLRWKQVITADAESTNGMHGLVVAVANGEPKVFLVHQDRLALLCEAITKRCVMAYAS